MAAEKTHKPALNLRMQMIFRFLEQHNIVRGSYAKVEHDQQVSETESAIVSLNPIPSRPTKAKLNLIVFNQGKDPKIVA
jgi:DNA/RNA endonuclease YhcR with UshA esterase domain